jgi:hypothetical protein
VFSQQTVVIEIDQAQLSEGPTRVRDLLKQLSAAPKKAREQRSAFIISFEGAGIANASRDPRSRSYLRRLVEAVPYVGYFLNGDPPLFRLRAFIMALAHSETSGPTVESFMNAHNRLYERATAHCTTVGDLPSTMEEIFIVNIIPDVLRDNPKLQARAMRALFPTFEQVRSASPQLRKRVFSEAEQIWGRSVGNFASPEVFVRDFERAFKQQLATP